MGNYTNPYTSQDQVTSLKTSSPCPGLMHAVPRATQWAWSSVRCQHGKPTLNLSLMCAHSQAWPRHHCCLVSPMHSSVSCCTLSLARPLTFCLVGSPAWRYAQHRIASPARTPALKKSMRPRAFHHAYPSTQSWKHSGSHHVGSRTRPRA